MKNFSKFFSVLLAAAMVLSLAACGNSDKPEEITESEAESVVDSESADKPEADDDDKEDEAPSEGNENEQNWEHTNFDPRTGAYTAPFMVVLDDCGNVKNDKGEVIGYIDDDITEETVKYENYYPSEPLTPRTTPIDVNDYGDMRGPEDDNAAANNADKQPAEKPAEKPSAENTDKQPAQKPVEKAEANDTDKQPVNKPVVDNTDKQENSKESTPAENEMPDLSQFYVEDYKPAPEDSFDLRDMFEEDNDSSSNNGGSSSDNHSNSCENVIKYTNEKRAEAGVGDVVMDDTLMSIAATRANDLLSSFDHTRPNGEKWYALFEGIDSVTPTGENIARGPYNSKSVVGAWYNSEGHRVNMLNSEATLIGVARADNCWVMILGK